MSKIVSNKNQLSRLVEIMEASPDFAKGIWTKPLMNKKWAEITVELNSLGPPERDSTKWQRVWADLKCKTKKKRTQNKIEIVATGGGPNKLHRLTDTEEAVSALMHLDSCIDPPGTEFGLEQPNSSAEDEREMSQDSVVEPKVPTRKVLKEKNDVHRLQLLEKQTSTQDKFYSSMVDSINEMKQHILNIQKNLSEIEYFSKKCYQLKKEKKREILKLKKEKLNLQRDKFEFKKQYIRNKENDRKIKLNLKIQVLEIEKKKQSLKIN